MAMLPDSSCVSGQGPALAGCSAGVFNNPKYRYNRLTYMISPLV